jgi:uncharacterized protein (DUF486 family)
MHIPAAAQSISLLSLSIIFRTFVGHGHLKNLPSKPRWISVPLSWGSAVFEYLLQVPANRNGYTRFSLAQLKIMRQTITLSIFVPFAMLYMIHLSQPFKLNYLWVALCLAGADYFIFRI